MKVYIGMVVLLSALTGCVANPMSMGQSDLEEKYLPFDHSSRFAMTQGIVSEFVNSDTAPRRILVVDKAINHTDITGLPKSIKGMVEDSLNVMAGERMKVVGFDPEFMYWYELTYGRKTFNAPRSDFLIVAEVKSGFTTSSQSSGIGGDGSGTIDGEDIDIGADLGGRKRITSINLRMAAKYLETQIYVEGLVVDTTVEIYEVDDSFELDFLIGGSGARFTKRVGNKTPIDKVLQELIEYSSIRLLASIYTIPNDLLASSSPIMEQIDGVSFSKAPKSIQIASVQWLLNQHVNPSLEVDGIMGNKTSSYINFYLNKLHPEAPAFKGEKDLQRVYKLLLDRWGKFS